MNAPFDMEIFLSSTLKGSQATRIRHLRQAEKIQAAICERWGRSNPWTWQKKHLTWFLNSSAIYHSPATHYYYKLTARLIESRSNKTWL
ncbi:hypothetical protein QN410_14115 [Pseudomonas sp. Bout1]|nr:hypothetical protein [Pseudomonas sp. Bout1]